MQHITGMILALISCNVVAVNHSAAAIFGYQEIHKTSLALFPQWLSVLERELKEITPAGGCDSSRFNQCHYAQWQSFLEGARTLPMAEKIRRVNEYANQKRYILDIENYGVEDYWATPVEFLQHNGDCEDYAIIKMLSLKQLGFKVEDMRIVVVQDTNLKVPHAVMAINQENDILILDNQIKQVISHKKIYHYVPVYSLNEKNWWMHLPNMPY